MKKENNQEFYVEQMDVHYPRRSEIQNEIEDIILKGMPQKISFLKRMKKIYLGPGLRVIYYKNLSVFFATFIIYFAVCLGLVLSFEEEIRQFGAAFLGMPVFFLLFSYFTCYMDEQTQINELRNTMYYSMNYIVSLRLFYTAVVLSLVNTSFLFLSGIREKAILSVGVVGVSSTSLNSCSIFARSNPVKRWRRISRIAWACFSLKWNFSINALRAISAVCDWRIVAITSSRWSRAILRPSRI